MALFEKRETWHVSQTPPGSIIRGWGSDTYAGKEVSPDSALSVTAVYACVRGLSETISTLPLFVYRRLSGGNKARAIDNPLYRILHDAPNPEHTSQVFRELLAGHALLWGNAYAQIIRNQAGAVAELWPLRPDRMTVERRGGVRVYTYRKPDRSVREFAASEILHIPAFGYDGLTGYSPIYLARNAISVAMAAEEFGGRFFANDARPGVVLMHPHQLTDQAYERLKESWDENHRGAENAHKADILEEGMDIKEIGMPPEDAQFLQTRAFQVAEIARIYRYPLALLEEHDKAATYASVEQFMLSFVTHTLRPWLVRFEQAMNMSLLTAEEQNYLYCEHLVDGLLRGDIKTRYEAYAIGRQWGWFTANDVLRIENMNSFDGGDEHLAPLNMVPVGKQTRQALEAVVSEAARRVCRREVHDVGEALKKGKDEAWMDGFYREHAGFIEKAMRPGVEAMARVLGVETPDVGRIAQGFCAGGAKMALSGQPLDEERLADELARMVMTPFNYAPIGGSDGIRATDD